jgi:GTP-binding protein
MTETDFNFDAETLEAGRKLFTRPCTFMLSVANLDQLPASDKDEIAFVGRSNVGKSSLINALFSKTGLAKTSSTPGRTQQLNFFNLDNKLYLVDLPGYGFAKAPPEDVKKWQRTMNLYLQGRPNLRRVFLLVDSRHGIKKIDEDIMKTLDSAAVTYQIILTKTDKINRQELTKLINDTQTCLKLHAAAHPIVYATSSEKKEGLENIRAEIAILA